MKKYMGWTTAIALAAVFFLIASSFVASSAWARAGGGGSFGSRGSRSFSMPSMPSSPSPFSGGYGNSGGSWGQPSSGGTSRSPFSQGLAGGLAGGLLGNLLFGGMGHAYPMGGSGGGGVGLLDLIALGVLGYFLWKFMKWRRDESTASQSTGGTGSYRSDEPYGAPPFGASYGGDRSRQEFSGAGDDELARGFAHIRQFDPAFSEEGFKEEVQDVFFRIQAGWMNRSLEGIEPLLTPEMGEEFGMNFDRMKREGRTNRLENIAIRKVQPTEVWQETGQEYATVLLTANLLDYTLDDKTGQVVEGDRLNPVKFQEFWTFSRAIGTHQWKLSAINQAK